MQLENKDAVIYGAVARAFAREGAKVFLTGRTLTRLDGVAAEIRSAGGVAETAHVDALGKKAVDQHADAVAQKAGNIDISFNLISLGNVQGTPLAEILLQRSGGQRLGHAADICPRLDKPQERKRS
jgi:3-oxoacyl-[acyl-carrier protein] reductase